MSSNQPNNSRHDLTPLCQPQHFCFGENWPGEGQGRSVLFTLSLLLIHYGTTSTPPWFLLAAIMRCPSRDGRRDLLCHDVNPAAAVFKGSHNFCGDFTYLGQLSNHRENLINKSFLITILTTPTWYKRQNKGPRFIGSAGWSGSYICSPVLLLLCVSRFHRCDDSVWASIRPQRCI